MSFRMFFNPDILLRREEDNSLTWKHDREFLLSLNFSEMAFLSSCINAYGMWQSAWGRPPEEDFSRIVDLVEILNHKLRGEPVDTIAEKLNAINTTLQEIRDRMGSGTGDGEGNTIQDLIFWIKVLFALTTSTPPAGLSPASVVTEPYLALINDKLEGLGLILGLQTASLEEIRAELEGIKEKECASPAIALPPVYLPQEIAENALDLVRNGAWAVGYQNSEGVFVADSWTYDFEVLADSPVRSLESGTYIMSFVDESAYAIQQTFRVPPGYGNLQIRITNPPGFTFEGVRVDVGLNGSVVDTILNGEELPQTYIEKSVYGNGGENVTIFISAEGSSSGHIGVVECLAFPVGLTTKTQVVGVGGQRGKGKTTADRLVKEEWKVLEETGSALVDWVVEKIDMTRDWLVMRLGEGSALGLSHLKAAKEFRLDFGTKIATVSFNMSLEDSGSSYIQLEYLDPSSEWVLYGGAQTPGRHSIKLDFQELYGDDHTGYYKIIRVIFNGYTENGQVNSFFIYDLEIEESD